MVICSRDRAQWTKVLIDTVRSISQNGLWRRVRIRRGSVKNDISMIRTYLKGEIENFQQRATEESTSSRRRSMKVIKKDDDDEKYDGKHLVC